MVTGGLAAPASADAGLSFDPYTSYHPGSEAANVTTADVTGDGRVDVLLTTDYSGPGDSANWGLWVYAQQPDGTLADPVHLATSGSYWSHMGVTVADLDEQMGLDVAVTTKVGVDIFSSATGTLELAQTVPIPEGRDVVAHDVTGDWQLDLIVNTQTGIKVWERTAAGFVPALSLSDSFVTELEVGDVNNDEYADVVSVSGDELQVRLAQPDSRTFAAPATYQLQGLNGWNNANGLAIGDLDGDNRWEVAVTLSGNRPNSSVQLWIQQDDGTLGTPFTVPSYDIPDAITASDVDRDGDDDLVVAHAGWNKVGVYRQVAGDFFQEDLFDAPYNGFSPGGLAVADISDDGRPDIMVTDHLAGMSVLRGVAPTADTTPPDTFITSGPSGSIQVRNAMWTFHATETVTYQCSLDNAPFTPCTSPASYTNLSDGPHTFAVRAVDTTGNIDPTPDTRSVSVDGPDTTITSGPTGTIRSAGATFGFGGGVSFECALDNAAWAACKSPTSYDGLAPGTSHTFKVRGLNSAGIPDGTPATRSFSIDTAANLGVTSSATPDPVKKGGVLTYTTSVTNTGPHAASGVVLTQGLPTGLTFRSASGCTGTTTVRCELGSVAPGATATVTITATVTATKGTLASTAVVTTSSWELNPANDSASVSVRIGSGR